MNRQWLGRMGVIALILIGLGVAVLVVAVAAFFRPNMEFIYKDDVTLWNRLRGNPGVTIIEMREPSKWGLVLNIDGEEFTFDGGLDFVRMQSEGSTDAIPNPEFPSGTTCVLWKGIRWYELDGSLVGLHINAIHTRGRVIRLRTKNSDEWVEFPGFGKDQAIQLFGTPDRSNRVFMQ